MAGTPGNVIADGLATAFLERYRPTINQFVGKPAFDVGMMVLGTYASRSSLGGYHNGVFTPFSSSARMQWNNARDVAAICRARLDQERSTVTFTVHWTYPSAEFWEDSEEIRVQKQDLVLPWLKPLLEDSLVQMFQASKDALYVFRGAVGNYQSSRFVVLCHGHWVACEVWMKEEDRSKQLVIQLQRVAYNHFEDDECNECCLAPPIQKEELLQLLLMLPGKVYRDGELDTTFDSSWRKKWKDRWLLLKEEESEGNKKRLALAQSQHDRIGSDSLLHKLPEGMLEHIVVENKHKYTAKQVADVMEWMKQEDEQDKKKKRGERQRRKEELKQMKEDAVEKQRLMIHQMIIADRERDAKMQEEYEQQKKRGEQQEWKEAEEQRRFRLKQMALAERERKEKKNIKQEAGGHQMPVATDRERSDDKKKAGHSSGKNAGGRAAAGGGAAAGAADSGSSRNWRTRTKMGDGICSSDTWCCQGCGKQMVVAAHGF